MSDAANVLPNDREIQAARDAAPVMLELLKDFVQAHHERNTAAIDEIATTAQQVVAIVIDMAIRPQADDDGVTHGE